MESEDPAVIVLEAMDKFQIPYMLVGSYSSNLYGIPRSTKDADFLVETTDERISELLPILTPHFRVDPQFAFETVTGKQKILLHHRQTQFQIEIFLMSEDAYDRCRFDRRVNQPLGDRPVPFPTPEDVIINKLRWFHRLRRGKDVLDTMTVMQVQVGRLDWAYIEQWCDKLGVLDLLHEVRRSAGV